MAGVGHVSIVRNSFRTPSGHGPGPKHGAADSDPLVRDHHQLARFQVVGVPEERLGGLAGKGLHVSGFRFPIFPLGNNRGVVWRPRGCNQKRLGGTPPCIADLILSRIPSCLSMWEFPKIRSPRIEGHPPKRAHCVQKLPYASDYFKSNPRPGLRPGLERALAACTLHSGLL